MKKMMIKLIAVGLALVLAATVATMSSYAWLTLSDSPAANGIYIAIGGGSTIMLAPDLTQTAEDGTIYHYPGVFSDTLNFNQYGSYSYLSDLGGLTPVSTTDGINWILPQYYQKTDAEVISGAVKNGTLKSIDDFLVDDNLAYANLSSTETDKVSEGSYIYLDFWVVSPGADYRLRVSTGDEEEAGGSFVIGLMEAEEVDTNGDEIADSYQLVSTGDAAAASARVGFLVNETPADTQTMVAYADSPAYSTQYRNLKGVYQEGGQTAYPVYHRFMIYEPNGTLHPGSSTDGSYVITKPLSYGANNIYEDDVDSNLTVQTASTWKLADEGEETLIQQVFQGMTLTDTFRSSTVSDLNSRFYNKVLQGQVGAYVTKGKFFNRTDNLYVWSKAGEASVENVDYLNSLSLVGATDDAYIVDLKRNVPQRIRMFIWLEGQDVDCTNDVKQSGIVVSIELAGSNNGV